MNTRSRVTRTLGAVLLVGGALLTAAPGVSAATPSAAASSQAVATLEPPTLTSATFIKDDVSGDHVLLLWNPAPGEEDLDHAVYANGKFLYEAPAFDNPFFGHLSEVFLEQRGLTGSETFTLTTRDSQGHESAQGNGMVAVPQKTLPAPKLTSAVIKDDHLVLTWEPSHTDEVSGNILYSFATGSVVNATTMTTPLTVSNPNDPTIPPFTVTKDTSITIVAEDRTMATSPPSNALKPTVEN